MNKADTYLYESIKEILASYKSETSRAKYKNGQVANSYYKLGAYFEYNLTKGEFPITSLRPIPWKSAIKEMLWIYQDQTSNLNILRDKYNVHYWDEWNIGNNTIGERYGAIVKKHKIIDRILKQLKDNPFNRRNIISLWDYESFDNTDGLFPCAFMTMFDVRKEGNIFYLDCTLIQRSGDLLVANSINSIQYVALQMMIAKHFGWEVGMFRYFVNNLHIYDNQIYQAKELLRRYEEEKVFTNPQLCVKIKQKDFYDFSIDYFELINYQPIRPQLNFELAI